MAALDRLRRESIAVVDLQGTIGGAIRPLDSARLLTKLRDDASARAVVLNIDSPGGSASGSDLIAKAVGRVRAEKPVIAFIGGLGASGGYMIAAVADGILSLPSALIGSIGVIAYRPLVTEALDRVGVRMRVAKSGRLKDMLSPFREATEEERAKEQHIVDTLHQQFVEGVARGRALAPERVRDLATGEIYAAPDALSAGLIDRMGDIEDAIDWAVERSGAPRRVRLVRQRRSIRDLVMGRTPGALTDALGIELGIGSLRGPLAWYDGR